ncbi:hypothetical protein ACTXJR_06070 [Glutamicibacter ardleyensis]|uniref:hypothetical protein n=1 Tax=Glutamicibacter ardleyensis TaxID=225894 RepID=UPI003FD14BC2
MFQAFYSINGGTEFEGNRSTSHNAALRNTRKLFTGEGYRADTKEGRTSYLVLRNSENTAVIRIERVES